MDMADLLRTVIEYVEQVRSPPSSDGIGETGLISLEQLWNMWSKSDLLRAVVKQVEQGQYS